MTYGNGYPAAYCSLDRLKRHIDTAETSDDDLLTEAIYAASGEIEKGCNRTFIDYVGARRFDAPSMAAMLWLDEDCVDVESLSDGRGALLPDTYLANPLNSTSRQWIELLPSGGGWTWGSTRRAAVTVTGTWGYRGSSRWMSKTTLTAGVNAVTDTLPLASAAGISALDYLMIGSEILHVLQVDTLANAAVVERGARGTTPAEALIGATVKRLHLMDALLTATALLAIYLYERRDEPNGQPVQIPDGRLVLTDYVPKPVKTFVSAHRRMPGIKGV